MEPREPERRELQPRMSRTGYEALDPLVNFCGECGGPRCYGGWPRRLIAEYLCFHLANQCVVWMYEPCNARELGTYQSPDRVLGLGIAWPATRGWIEERTAAGLCVFDWRPVDWEADSIYLADWVVRPDRLRRTEVPRRREVIRTLARTLWCRWPAQRGKPILYHRDGELVQMCGRVTGWAGLPQEGLIVDRGGVDGGRVESLNRKGKELVYG